MFIFVTTSTLGIEFHSLIMMVRGLINEFRTTLEWDDLFRGLILSTHSTWTNNVWLPWVYLFIWSFGSVDQIMFYSLTRIVSRINYSKCTQKVVMKSFLGNYKSEETQHDRKLLLIFKAHFQ
jgi:hypothetical protein